MTATTVARTSREQDALRMLVLIRTAGGPPDALAPASATAMIRSQMRLQALDFWLRNPDYLAYELVNEHEAGTFAGDPLSLARWIVDSNEPDLRRYPMVRYLFGAYEPLDDALALLKLPGYIAIRRKERGRRVGQHRYYLLEAGDRALDEILRLAPDLAWYVDRAGVVASIAGSASGKALKDRQYRNMTYKSTRLGDRIAPVTEEVRTRLAALSA
jgi:hypothetical protein